MPKLITPTSCERFATIIDLPDAGISDSSGLGRTDVAGMNVAGDMVLARFCQVGGGLVARALPAEYQPISDKPEPKPLVRKSPGTQLKGFQLRGQDGCRSRWQCATAGRISNFSICSIKPDCQRRLFGIKRDAVPHKSAYEMHAPAWTQAMMAANI